MSTNTSATRIEKPATRKPTVPSCRTEALVRESLEDIAIVIGGAAALHHIDDDLVWTVMKRLDRIRVRLLRDLKGLPVHDSEPSTPKPPRVHAAVEEFLVRNRAGMGE